MGFFDSISDMWEAAVPWSVAEAEAPKEETEEKDDGDEEKVRAYCLFSGVRGAVAVQNGSDCGLGKESGGGEVLQLGRVDAGGKGG